jgi:hypothetical protein
LIVHFLFPLPFKPAKGDRGIGRTEIPERPATQAVPEPDKTDGKIEYVKIPKFPMGQSLKYFFHSHVSGKNNI